MTDEQKKRINDGMHALLHACRADNVDKIEIELRVSDGFINVRYWRDGKGEWDCEAQVPIPQCSPLGDVLARKFPRP